MYQRLLDIASVLKERSVFLFGARQTGKSTLLQRSFPDARYVNLLAADTFRELSAKPERLRQTLLPSQNLIILDEIQKLPHLLDEVHLMIEENKKRRFILTGSSARKLKRGGVNLLGGRARTYHLFPLVWPEFKGKELAHRMLVGGLPSVLDSAQPWEDLNEYIGTYLKEEIRAEALARSIEAFSRFLHVAGVSNGEQLNFTKVGSDAQVPPRTVREYFSVLEDTLIGFQLFPYQRARSRKAVATAKFYFFDTGVAHALQGIKQLAPGTALFGKALEHYIATELRAYLSYRRDERPLCYWRTTSQIEVDFIVGDSVAIEVKGTGRVSDRDAKPLVQFSEDRALKRKIIVCTESQPRRLTADVQVLPVEQFLDELWCGELLDV